MNNVTIGDFDRYESAMMVTLYHFTELMNAGLIEGPARLSAQGVKNVEEALANGFEFNEGEFEEMIAEVCGADWDSIVETRQ